MTYECFLVNGAHRTGFRLMVFIAKQFHATLYNAQKNLRGL